jgi:hypothetical protein
VQRWQTTSRIASLKSEQARLAQRELELAAVRREEVGKLADRMGVLEAEDDVFSGLLLELKAAMENQSSRLAQWRDAGLTFRCGKAEKQRNRAGVAQHANCADKAAGA